MRKFFTTKFLAALALMALLPQMAALAQTGVSSFTFTLLDANLNQMTKSYDEATGNYTLTTTGTDPYVFTDQLQDDLAADANTLSFEYNCPSGIGELQIFFPDPLSEANSVKTPIPATGEDEWKTFTYDITDCRNNFAWGYAGNYLRLDFGGTPDVTIKLRNVRVSSPAQVTPAVSFNTESDLNDLTVSYDGNTNIYTFTTTGGDPHINTTKLAEALESDANILTFEYNAPTGVNGVQVFFLEPTTEARSVRGLQLDATGENEWKTFQLNIEESRNSFNWGNAGDLLRIDFGSDANVSFRARNLNIISSSQLANLQDYIDGLKFGIDDYVNGPAPGCIGDTAIYTEFYEAYSNALWLAGNASATDEQKTAALDALKNAKAKIDEAINPIEDGTYYIETAYSVFEGKDTMAWYAPRQANQPGWHKKAASVLSMWNIRKLADGNFSIQNAATGQYINHNATVDAADQPLLLSDELETEQVIDMIKPNGQFNIHSLGANWTYNIQGHNAGNGTDGPIANWTTKAADGEGAWRIIPVPEADIAAAQATQNRELLIATVKTFSDNYQVGTDPGYYSKDAYDAFIAEYNAAKTLAEDSDNIPTEDACKAELEKYNAAKAALDNALVPITNGYYAILSKPYDESLQTPGLAWSVNGESGYPYSFTWESGNPDFIWQITSVGTDRFSVQNYTSKEYIGTSDLLQQGASVSLTKTPSSAQIFPAAGNGAFKASNTSLSASGFYYAVEQNNYLWIQNGGSSVYLHKYTDDEVASIVSAYPQKLRNDSLADLIAEATPRVEGNDSVYSVDTAYANRLITDKSQLFITNQSTEGADLGRLLDNDSTTHCISAYNESVVDGTAASDYHAIRIDAGEGKTLPRNLALWWRTRNSVWRNMYRPTDVRLYASNDLVSWDFIEELTNPEAGFPTTADKPEYLSPKPIILTKPYRYLNMKVITTNTANTGYLGYQFFTFSEFNAYAMTATYNDEMKNNPELANAISALRSAITAGQAKVDAGSVTSQDIAEFRAAYTEFLLNVKDTSDLYNMYVAAEELSPTVVVGDDMFCYPEEQASAFEEAYAEVDAARPFTDINQREVARLDTLLTRAYNNLLRSMIGPDPDVWYTVYSMDETQNDRSGNPIKGQIAWVGGLSSSDGFACGGDQATAMMTDLRRAWKFEPTGTPNIYNMINVGNGWPINRGPVRLAGLGDGQFAIYTGPNYDQLYFIYPAVLPGVPGWSNRHAVKDGEGAWAMEQAPEELTYTLRLNQGRVMAFVFPYDTYDVPSGLNGEPVSTYSVCGYQVGEDGKTITGINLSDWTDDGIKAGTPFIIAVEGDDAYNPDSVLTVDFYAKVNGTVTREITPQNGLYGTFSNIAVPEGMIYFLKDSAYVEPEGFTVNIQRAYLDVNGITIDPELQVDRTVPVNGVISTTVGIKQAVSAQKAIVDVYTSDGVLVRRNVKASEAAKGLAKGIYIIGKKKVLVK